LRSLIADIKHYQAFSAYIFLLQDQMNLDAEADKFSLLYESWAAARGLKTDARK